MAQGYQEHGPAEVALPKYILLKPESVEDWESRELARMDEEYRETMRAFQTNDDE